MPYAGTYNFTRQATHATVVRNRFDDGDFDTTNIDFVIDANNHTGSAQVIEEWDVTGAADMDKSYTIGHDHIAQWDDDTDDVLYLLADGHGSTRLLTDDTGAVGKYGGD